MTVRELGDLAAFGGRLLASLGATVVKTSTAGDDLLLDTWRDGGKSVEPPAGLEAFDLVLDGRPAGARPLDPVDTGGAMVVRVTEFGEEGPWSSWHGGEAVHQALSGFMALNGYDGPDEPPVAVGGRQVEVVAGVMAAIGALLLLEGRGRAAATSWHEATSVGHETEFAAWTARGERLVRHTGQHASVADDPPRLQWRAGDGRYVNLILPALTRDRWATLVEWLDGRAMAADLTDDRWLKGLVRLQEEKHIYEVLAAFVATLPAEEVFAEGQQRDLPWAAVRRPEENRDQPQFAGRPIFAAAGDGRGGSGGSVGSGGFGLGLPWRVHEGPPSGRRPRPLDRLRVLDFTWQVMGPTVTRILAHAGAEVAKVERPGKPELMRLMAVGRSGLFPGEGSPFFANLNAGKHSIGVNLVDDRELVLELVAAADVVVENFSSRVMERLGLGFDDLRAANPAVVYVSLSGFGHEGPLRDYDTWGPTAQAISGCTWLSRDPQRDEPAGWGWSYLDYLGGYFGAIGALSAVHATRRDTRARWVDVSQVECGMTCASLALLDPERADVQPPSRPAVRAADGRWVVGLDGPVDDAYAAVTKAQTDGTAAGLVQDQADRLAQDPQLAFLGTYPEVDGRRYEATPIRIDGSVLPIGRPAPTLGGDTEEVLARWLSS